MKTWEDCVNFHGHVCPGLAIGYRAAVEAIRILGLTLEKDNDEDIVTVIENDACGVDAMQVMLGTSAGKGNLIARPRGKMAFSVYNRTNGKSVRLVLKPFDNDSMSREKRTEFLKSAPLDQVYEVKETTFVLPEKARHFKNIICEKCGESTAEPMIRLEEGKALCMDCYSPYTRTY